MKIFNRHCAYNLTTGEILACDSVNHLKRCVAIVSQNDKAYGVRSEWVFGHQGISLIMEKARRISKARCGR